MRQRKAREFLGLHSFLNHESWYGPADFAALAEKAKKHLGRVKDAWGFTVNKIKLSDGASGDFETETGGTA